MVRISSSPSSVSLGAFRRASAQIETSLERLATGKRINRAADDPSGVITAESMRNRVVTLDRQISAFQRNNLSLAATEGHLSTVSDAAIELKGLLVTAANRDGLGEDELKGIETQIVGILDGLAYLKQTAEYDGAQTLGGLNLTDLDALRPGGESNVVDGDLEAAQKIAEGFAEGVDARRAAIGTLIKSNESQIAAFREEFEQTSEALSQIEDTDYAKEVSELARAQALQSAALTTEAVARQQADIALSLLEGARNARK